MKFAPEPDARAVLSEEPIAHRVEGAPHEAPRVDGQQGLDAPQHLAGRFVREGQQEDARGICPGFDQAGHPVDESPGLPRPGAGNDEDRPSSRQDDRTLLVVQFPVVVHPVGHRTGGSLENVAAIHGGSLGHTGPDVILLAASSF